MTMSRGGGYRSVLLRAPLAASGIDFGLLGGQRGEGSMGKHMEAGRSASSEYRSGFAPRARESWGACLMAEGQTARRSLQ
jgi:hypothetical protein